MPDSPRKLRDLHVTEWSDGDALVVEDRYDHEPDVRTARLIYRTSALPDGFKPPAARYALADQTPAVIAVHPDVTAAVVITKDATGRATVTLARSLRGDTTVDGAGSHTYDQVDELVAFLTDWLHS